MVDISIVKSAGINRMPFNYNEIDDIIMTLIDYLKEIWGFVNTQWKVYGFYKRSTPNWKNKATTRSTKPTNDTSVLNVNIRIKEVKVNEGMYYSDDMKKNINDILIDLIDDKFKYSLDIQIDNLSITLEKNDLYKKIFNKSDIVETFLMLEDYMKEEWGNYINISYEYHAIGPATRKVNIYGATDNFKANTVTDIKMESLTKLKFSCSK